MSIGPHDRVGNGPGSVGRVPRRDPQNLERLPGELAAVDRGDKPHARSVDDIEASGSRSCGAPRTRTEQEDLRSSSRPTAVKSMRTELAI